MVTAFPHGATPSAEATLTPEAIPEALQLARLHLDAGTVHQAAALYRRIIELHPNNAGALQGCAAASFQLRDYEAAVKASRAAARVLSADAGIKNLLGRACKALGRLDEAIKAYRESLALDPRQADTLVSLGIALRAKGAIRESIRAYRRALDVDPDYALAHHNLANSLLAEGELQAARESYERALSLEPKLGDAHFELANLDLLAKDADRAKAHYRRAAELGLNSAKAALRTGNMLLALGDRDSALLAFTRAASLEPSNQEALFQLGRALHEHRDFDAAVTVLSRAVQLAPGFADAHVNLGVALRGRGAYEQASACWRKALELDPDTPAAHLGLAMLDCDFGRYESARQTLAGLVGRDSSYLDAWLMLTVACRELNEIGEAFEASARALALKPDLPQAHMNHGTLCLPSGDAAAALASYNEARRLDPSWVEGWQIALGPLNYIESENPLRVLEGHREFGARFFAGGAAPRASGASVQGRKIKLGYLSPDLFSHSVSYFFEPLLSSHDKTKFEIYCYHLGKIEDETTRRMQACADQWRSCARATDAELQRLIADDRLDVLIDLAGHTRGSRVRALGARCAPVQITWLGYPTTTGLPAMDFRITDRIVDPEGYEPYSTERLLRLERSYYCYRPPEDAPEVSAAPAAANAHVTFGSFNNLAKLSDAAVLLWSAVLQAVPGSRLLTKSAALADDSVRRRTAARFEARGIDPSRLGLMGRVRGVPSHLELYRRVDVGLDTYPYNGATTTCEALWMGVPVVTRAGPTHASRMGASILNAAGRPEWVADSDAKFVEICQALAADRAGLAELRQNLRAQLAASVLTDASTFARNFESLIESCPSRLQ